VSDSLRETIAAEVRGALGDAVIDSMVKPGDDIWMRIRTDAWRSSMITLHESLGAAKTTPPNRLPSAIRRYVLDFAVAKRECRYS